MIGLCTRLRESAFKRSLAGLPVGAPVEIEQPKGTFVLPEDSSWPLVFIAGGIGITAFRSMLRYIQDKRLPHRVTLIYSDRDLESTAFLDELDQIASNNPNVRLIATMTDDPSWVGEHRRIDATFLNDHVGDDLNDSRYMIAGPPAMAKAVTEELEQAGIDETLIATDSFSGY